MKFPRLAENVVEHSQAPDKTLRLRGNTFFKKGCYKEAVQVYTNALEAYEEGKQPDPRLLNNRATAYLKLGKFQQCLQDSEDYIKILPTCWKGYTRKALALNGLGLRLSTMCSAAIAYCHDASCCRRYELFSVKFKDVDGNWEVVDSSETLKHSLSKYQGFYSRKIILLQNSQCDLSDVDKIANITLATLESESDVTIKCNELVENNECFFQNITFSPRFTVSVRTDNSVEFYKCSFASPASQEVALPIQNEFATFLECQVRDCKGGGILIRGPTSSAALIKCEISGCNGKRQGRRSNQQSKVVKRRTLSGS